MSTYVVSDLHGCYDDFMKILEAIRFTDCDRLILAGDLIERGPQDYEMLKWMEECPANVLLLRGNHEEEFAGNISLMEQVSMLTGEKPESRDAAERICHFLESHYYYFDYYGSIKKLVQENSVCLQDLKKWAEMFRSWPCQYKLQIHNRNFVIVHGCIEDLKLLPDNRHYSGMEEFNLYAREEASPVFPCERVRCRFIPKVV